MTNRNEQKFYSALKDVFVGEKVEGESGYVNLMKIKNEYFEKIKPFIEREINETISDDSAREELFEKLYTFFESYFSDTGTPFFDKTQLHKNLYEKVYTERDDVSLFWKTQKLYYVKSEANYTSMNLPDIDGFKFIFNASEIEHQKSNEKKNLEFYLTDTEENKLTFKVRYVDNTKSKWNRLKTYSEQDTPAKVRKHLAENLDDIDHGSINVITNSMDRTDLRLKFIEDNIIIKNNDDSIQSVDVEFAVSKLKNLETYFAKRNIIIDIATVKKAFTIYKKQNEVDYFIHKDAEGFLKEQFDIYLYNYLFGEGGLESEWQQDRINDIQNIKKIAHSVIEYIARFEDELKAIWEKPKFVRNSNYVFTLDRIKDNVELIEKIISHEGFEKQVDEWKKLRFVNDGFSKEKIITNGNLSEPHFKLPIDTKYFTEIKSDVLECFIEIDNIIDGIIINSDGYHALESTKDKYNSNIQTIYIDPPFNLDKNADFPYKVKYKDSTWITMLENRVNKSKQFLKNDGSIYVRCDYNGNMYVRMLLNQIFGENNFRNEILLNRFKKGSNGLTNSSESLFLYSKNEMMKFLPIEKHRDCTYCKQTIEQKWQWSHSAGESSIPKYFDVNGERVLLYPPKGRHWTNSQEKIDYLTENGMMRIDENTSYTDYNGNRINFIPEKLQASEIPIDNNWTDIPGYEFGVYTAEKFSTQNSEELLKRVVNLTTGYNDFVMDYFSGSGTTVAVAHKMGRKWFGVEMADHFYGVILPRLKRVLNGDQAGISKDDDINWKGGGFFKYYELEQFEDALRLAKYNPKDDDLANVNFQKDEKLLDAVEIDRENENVRIHFKTLYPDVDIAETLSNLLGKKIKKLNNERVIFEDDMEIIFDEMTYEKYPWVKPLIWWKSK